MCGIVGIAANTINRDQRSLFEDLMLVSNLRGRWGAGICVVGDKKLMSYKTPWSGIDACDMKGYNEHVNRERIMTLIGHTRWPTKGENDVSNAHPHSFPKITGVHNGTLTKVDGKEPKGKESDSVKFYRHANEVGFDKALARAQGAYAFVYVDHETRRIHFIRNAARPLSIARIGWGKFGQFLIWASEKEMIEFVCKRRNVKIDSIEELPVNEMWSIDNGFVVGDDFKVEKGCFGGSDLWVKTTPITMGGHSNWSAGFRGASSTSVPALNDKATYVFKDGEFVEKSSLTNPPAKKVSLPRSETENEQQGKAANGLPASQGAERGVAVEQRQKATSKVSLGSNGAAFLKNLIKPGISKAEQEFYAQGGDNVVDLFPAAEEKDTEKEFLELLSTRVNTEVNQLWEDLQDDHAGETLFETIKGHFVPESEYKRLLKLGCAWHGDAAESDEDIYWLEKDSYIFDFVIYDNDAMEDLSLHYPNHPLMEEWVKKREDSENSDLYIPHPTLQ